MTQSVHTVSWKHDMETCTSYQQHAHPERQAPVQPQVKTPPRPFVLNEDPKSSSILFLKIPVDSSRHKFVQAMQLSPRSPCEHKAISALARKSSIAIALGKCCFTWDRRCPKY